MFDTLTISHFRAFEKLEVAPLHRVNLIAGGNNVGKTSLLEAIWFAAQDTPLTVSAPSLFRRSALDYSRSDVQQPQDDQNNFWKWLFSEKDISKPISIHLQSAATPDANRNLAIRFDAYAQKVSGQFVSPLPPSPLVCTTLEACLPSPVEDADRVNDVSVLNRESELAGYLRVIDPRIINLKCLKLSRHKYPYAYVDVGFGKGKELIPATQLGQGVARMIGLFAALMTEQTQILFIDEFENGLRHDALVPLWKTLGNFARERDMQIFATTHSYECIAAAHEAFSEHAEDFAVIKLRPDDEKGIAAFVLGYKQITAAIEAGWEIR